MKKDKPTQPLPREDDVLRRMLSMPPKPHVEKKAKKPPKKR